MQTGISVGTILVSPVEPAEREEPVGREEPVEQEGLDELVLDIVVLWSEAKSNNITYYRIVEAIQKGRRQFPTGLEIRVFIGECTLSGQGDLLFRGRRWVPDSEPLRTRIIQETHNSMIGGHPSREITSALLARQFFWLRMMKAVRQFVRNCDVYSANKA
jgi:hypothetical protein